MGAHSSVSYSWTCVVCVCVNHCARLHFAVVDVCDATVSSVASCREPNPGVNRCVVPELERHHVRRSSRCGSFRFSEHGGVCFSPNDPLSLWHLRGRVCQRHTSVPSTPSCFPSGPSSQPSDSLPWTHCLCCACLNLFRPFLGLSTKMATSSANCVLQMNVRICKLIV